MFTSSYPIIDKRGLRHQAVNAVSMHDRIDAVLILYCALFIAGINEERKI